MGCDDIINSGVKRDHCGKCGGDSSTCGKEVGEYTENWRKYGKTGSGVMHLSTTFGSLCARS